MYKIVSESEMFRDFFLAMEGLHKLKPRCGSQFLMKYEKTKGRWEYHDSDTSTHTPFNYSFTKD